MSRTFKKVDSDRVLDLTVRLGDCLPPNHLARFVVDSVYIPGFCGPPAIPVNLKQAMERKEKGLSWNRFIFPRFSYMLELSHKLRVSHRIGTPSVLVMRRRRAIDCSGTFQRDNRM
jgi:hypothetical protein